MSDITSFTIANRAFRNRQYSRSLSLYIQALLERPSFSEQISHNLMLAKKRLVLDRRTSSLKKIALISTSLNDDKVNRLLELVDLYSGANNKIEVINLYRDLPFELSDKKSKRFTIKNIFNDEDHATSRKLFDFCVTNDYDRLALLNPRIEAILLGLFYKTIWDSEIVVDISTGINNDINNQLTFIRDFDIVTTDDLNYAAEAGYYYVKEKQNIIYQVFDKTPLFQRKKLISLVQLCDTEVIKFLILINNQLKHVASEMQIINDLYLEEEGRLNALDHSTLNPREADELLFVTSNARTFVKNLFNLALNRHPQDHEINHYLGLMERNECTRLQIAEILFYGEESRNYFNEIENKSKKKLKALPKKGDINPEDLVVPYHDNPLVSVLIPVYCKVEYTLACIQSILNNLPEVAFEILVLDDLSPDGSASLLEKIQNVRVVVNTVNLGFLRSCNRGATFAK